MCRGKMKSEKRHPILAFVRNRRRMIYGRTNAPPRPSPCRRRETSFRSCRPRLTSRLGFARGGREVTTKRSVVDNSGEIIVAGPTERRRSAAHFRYFRARFRADIFNSLFAFRTPTRARLEHTMRATLALRTTPGLARARVAPPRRKTRGVTVHTAAVHTQRDKNGRRDFHAENQEYYKKKEITNAMLVGAAIPAWSRARRRGSSRCRRRRRRRGSCPRRASRSRWRSSTWSTARECHVNSVGRIDDSPQTQFTSREPPLTQPLPSSPLLLTGVSP